MNEIISLLRKKTKSLFKFLRTTYKKTPRLFISIVIFCLVVLGLISYLSCRALISQSTVSMSKDTSQTSKNKDVIGETPSANNSNEKQQDTSAKTDDSSQTNSPKRTTVTTPTSTSPSNPNSPSTAPEQPAIKPYYETVLPATVTKTDNGATMTYRISMTIVPNSTFGNPMIRLQLFHPGVCINDADLTRIYRYNSQNTLSLACIIDKSQPAYGMTDLNLDFSIYKDNGEAIYGSASGWHHILPEGYNQ